MDKKIKLWVGIGLVGVAAYLILKPKAPTTTASTEPKCNDDEELVEETVNGKEVKVCKPKVSIEGGLACNIRNPNTGCYRPDLFTSE